MAMKILCPTDGSEHAEVGLAQAIELAKLSGARLTVCVVNIAHGGARGPTINHWTPEEAAALMSAAEAKGKAAGLADVGTAELVAREAAPAIIAYADQNGYDHIVMGTGDKRGVKRLVLGSVAAEVSGQAHCSVTVAR
ncbi:universal stress protein [Tabrizicola sp.]|uniref:universal stress protein n=1 Tax=Tabrizicola sp. TaxID=2005166 RepID=UPI003D2E223B